MEIDESHAQYWLNEVFSAKAVTKGGVVRRSRHWVAAEVGTERFQAEVRRRGFHLLECGPQYVVVCSQAPIRLIL